ncbi:MAG: hypothetical protein JSW62_06160 [Thermoplasmatales archaeon]|nr:MAG: hypothetical protein JSW62_06160 [Thermoplasmatales archaeon]
MANTSITETKPKVKKPLEIGFKKICSCKPNHINCITAKQWIQNQVAIWELYYKNRSFD